MLKPLPIYFLKKIVREYDLTPEQEEAFVARYSTDEEMGNAEVAKTLNISEGAFRTRMSGVYRKFSFTGNTSGKFYKLRNLLIDRFQPNESSGTTEKEPIEKNDDIDAIVQQTREAVRPLIEEQCGKMQVLDMECAIDLTGDRGVYTNVNILETLSWRRKPESRQDCDFANRQVPQKSIPGLEAVEKDRRLMVWGKPGAGKSTFLKYLAMQCIMGGFAANKVPFFVRLKDFAEAPKLPNLAEYIAERLTVETMDQLLSSGRALILLDGLDEVRGEDTKRVIKEIISITRKSDKNQLVITCRIAAKGETFGNFTHVEMADFDPQQIATFAENWFRARNNLPNAELFLRRLEQNKPIQELAKTPILLTLLCLVFEIHKDFPKNQVSLYEKGIDLLLQKWDENQGVERDLINQCVDLKFIKGLLSYIAFKSFTKQEYLIEQRQLIFYIEDFVKTLQQESAYSELCKIDRNALVKSIQVCHGLLIEQAYDTYSFSHLTVQEYFTAKNILDFSAEYALQKLIEHIWEPRWQEVFLLVTQGLKDPDYFLRSVKYQIDLMLGSDQKLQRFLDWGSGKTRTNAQGFESVVIRACYLGSVGYNPFSLNTDISKGSAISEYDYFEFYYDRAVASRKSDSPHRNCKLVSDLVLTECAETALGIDKKEAAEIIKKVDRLSRIKDISFDQALSEMIRLYEWVDYFLDGFFEAAYFVERHLSGSSVMWNADIISIVIEDQFKSLHSMLPTVDDSRNCLNWWSVSGEEWSERLRETIIECRNIGHNWIFTDEQNQKLQKYHDANILLVRCLKSDCSVSPTVREEIEAMLLLPITELKRRLPDQYGGIEGD